MSDIDSGRGDVLETLFQGMKQLGFFGDEAVRSLGRRDPSGKPAARIEMRKARTTPSKVFAGMDRTRCSGRRDGCSDGKLTAVRALPVLELDFDRAAAMADIVHHRGLTFPAP